jgi:hypothetical protein
LLLCGDVAIDLLRVVAPAIRTEDRSGLVHLRRSRLLHARLPAPPGASLASRCARRNRPGSSAPAAPMVPVRCAPGAELCHPDGRDSA